MSKKPVYVVDHYPYGGDPQTLCEVGTASYAEKTSNAGLIAAAQGIPVDHHPIVELTPAVVKRLKTQFHAKSRRWLINWCFDVDAATPQDAVGVALGAIRRYQTFSQGSIPWEFEVIDKEGKTLTLKVTEEDFAEYIAKRAAEEGVPELKQLPLSDAAPASKKASK